jgi:predicted nucleotidyltransferase
VIFRERFLGKKRVKNLDYPVYRKFLQVFLEKLEEGLKGDLLAMVLYGSVARGSAGPESDIDLLILYRKGKIDVDEVYSISDIQAGKSLEYQRLYKKGIYGEISPLFMTLEEIKRNPLILLDIMEEGIILFEQGKCFTELLKKMRDETRKLGSRKVNLPDGSWYWELKPSWKPGELIEVSL